MKSIIKIFGLYHSGTNVLSFLLKYNFNNFVCNDFLGWKHSYIYDLDYVKKVSKQSNDNVCIIFCVRNPYDWIWRTLQYGYEFIIKDLRQPVYTHTKYSQEYYSNIVDMYNKKMQNYKDFIEYNNCLYIKHEDLILNQVKTLELIENKYNLQRSFKDIVPFTKKINNLEYIESEFKEVTYTSYKNNFSLEDLEFINNNLDANLLKYFKY